MGRTYRDFSQLSRGMFKKCAPVEEVKPVPKAKAKDEDEVMAFFGLKDPKTPSDADGAAANRRVLALEAELRTARSESAALAEGKSDAERKAGDLARQLSEARQAGEAAEAERDRLRAEVSRLRNELEDALTAPPARSADAEPVREVRVDGLLKPSASAESFPGEIREHVLAALAEAREAAVQSGRERRASVLKDVLSANVPSGELDRRRKALRQIIKDTGSFVDARTIAALEGIGFKCVSGNKHWKLDYANVRIPMSKTPSDRRAALNAATDMANRCF